MTPVNHIGLSDRSVLSEIIYLDPDFENANHTWGRMTKRWKRLALGLILIVVFAAVIVLRHVRD